MEYPDKIKELLHKYWDAETSLDEEAQLKAYFSQEDSSVEGAYFAFIAEERNITRSAKPQIQHTSRRIHLGSMILRYAAVFAVIVAAGFLLYSVFDQSETNFAGDVTYEDSFEDPEAAYKEAREALLLVAAKIHSTQNQAARNVQIVEPYTNIIHSISSQE